jgi:hypothetical protein
MRQFETAAAPQWDADPAVNRLVHRDLHAGEAMAVALQLRDALIRLEAANNGAAAGTRAA